MSTRGGGRLALLFLVLWGLWGFALQAHLASDPTLGPWVPEVGIVLLFALDPHLPRGTRRLAAVAVACARLAVSAEPALAVLAGYLGVVGLLALLRRSVEVDRPLLRAVLAGLCTLFVLGFWILCRRIALREAGLPAPLPVLPWRGALSTGLVVLAALPVVRALPGLRPLVARRA